MNVRSPAGSTEKKYYFELIKKLHGTPEFFTAQFKKEGSSKNKPSLYEMLFGWLTVGAGDKYSQVVFEFGRNLLNLLIKHNALGKYQKAIMDTLDKESLPIEILPEDFSVLDSFFNEFPDIADFFEKEFKSPITTAAQEFHSRIVSISVEEKPPYKPDINKINQQIPLLKTRLTQPKSRVLFFQNTTTTEQYEDIIDILYIRGELKKSDDETANAGTNIAPLIKKTYKEMSEQKLSVASLARELLMDFHREIWSDTGPDQKHCEFLTWKSWSDAFPHETSLATTIKSYFFQVEVQLPPFIKLARQHFPELITLIDRRDINIQRKIIDLSNTLFSTDLYKFLITNTLSPVVCGFYQNYCARFFNMTPVLQSRLEKKKELRM